MWWPLFLLLMVSGSQERSIDEVIRVDMVLLDILVLDQTGQPVTGLTAEDFQIYENRRQVTPSFFDVLDLRNKTAATKPDEDVMMQTMVLVLDLGGTDIRSTRQSLTEVRNFLEALPAQLPMQLLIFSTDYGMVTQGFTTEQVTAMDDFTQFEVNFMDRREQLPTYHEKFSLVTLEREIRSCVPKTLSAPSAFRARSATEMAKNCVRQAFNRFSSIQEQKSLKTLTNLERVFASLAPIEGLKTLYFVTPGNSLQPGMAGAQLATRYVQSFNNRGESTLFGKISGSAPGVPAGNAAGDPFDFNTALNNRAPRSNEYDVGSLDRRIQRLAHMALTTRTVIHTFTLPHNYLLDRRTSNLGSAEANNLNLESAYNRFGNELDDGNKALSFATGGIHHRERALESQLQKTLGQTQYYYTLGYNKTRRGKKGFRNIRVKLNRKDVKVHHQSGYFTNKNR